MLTIKPLLSAAKKRLLRHYDDSLAPFRVADLHPGETLFRKRAHYLPGQLDKVKGYQRETNATYERSRIVEGEVAFAPTTLFELPDAQLIDGHVYCQGLRFPIASTRTRVFQSTPAKRFDSHFLAASAAGGKYFGHWLTDDCTTGMLAADIAPGICMDRFEWPHVAAYRELFDRRFPVVTDGMFRSLLLLADAGQNSGKRKRYETIRRRVAERFEARPGAVYVMRGRIGGDRHLVNELALAEELERNGFRIVDPAIESAESVLKKMSGATAVIGIEGSQLAPAILAMADGAAFITLQQPDKFNNGFRDIIDCLGASYGFVVGDRAGEGFSIDPGDVLRTVDLATGKS